MRPVWPARLGRGSPAGRRGLRSMLYEWPERKCSSLQIRRAGSSGSIPVRWMRLWRERLIGFEAMAIAPDPDSCVLFVAAEAREFSGLLRFCHAPQKLAWPVRWGRSASLNGCEILMLANGAGRAQAAAALEIARRMRKLTAVVSTGFCGALDPELAIGDIFVATRIESSEGCFGAALPLAAARHASGVLLSIDHVAQTADEKRVLHSAGAAAVEMEAAGLAALAAGSRLPLFCVRAVTDTASE